MKVAILLTGLLLTACGKDPIACREYVLPSGVTCTQTRQTEGVLVLEYCTDGQVYINPPAFSPKSCS